MKAFRGTLIVAILLCVVGLAVWYFEPRVADPNAEHVVQLFNFEKQDLVRVEIDRPDKGRLVLAEQPDGNWVVEGPGWKAGRSMVARVKHQIHDLTSRATVIEKPEAPELYGLGANAIRVHMFFRDKTETEFLAGDPNPSSVSYYIEQLPDGEIFTVKKSAMDYYSEDPVEFRERRFTDLDSNDADRVEADLPGGRRLVLQRLDEFQWQLEEPASFKASREEVRMLLGRVTSLKVRDYVEDHPTDLAKYGLDRPRAHIVVRFASRDPVDLRIGASAAPDEGPGEARTYAYMILAGDDTVVTARDDLVNDFVDDARDPEKLRLKRFMRMRIGDIVDAEVTLRTFAGNDLSGSVGVHKRADAWLWDDGTAVPGSTPERVALRAAELEAVDIAADRAGDGARWGFDAPILTVDLADKDGNQRSLLIGKETKSLTDDEGRTRRRFFARASDDEIVYVVDDGVLEVAEDAVREFQRKDDKDAQKEERREKMEKAIGPLPTPEASAVPPVPRHPGPPRPGEMPGRGDPKNRKSPSDRKNKQP
jgi:hypothetical protein